MNLTAVEYMCDIISGSRRHYAWQDRTLEEILEAARVREVLRYYSNVALVNVKLP